MPGLWYQIGNFASIFFLHIINIVQNISGNLQFQHWRFVVSSASVSAHIWEQRVCYLFAFRQLYSESSFIYNGGSEFLISHWKKSILPLALTYLDFTEETLLDKQELALSAVEVPEKWWEEHTRSIYKMKLFQATTSSIPILICQTSCISVTFEGIFL